LSGLEAGWASEDDHPLLSDEQSAVIVPLPPVRGAMGRPMRHRPVVEVAIYRLKAGIPWRYLPPQYGAWQTVHRRHHKWSTDGTWDRVLARLQAEADARGELDWRGSVDSTIARVHQHGATAARRVSGPLPHRGLVKNPQVRRDEPDDHGMGRSRGGLTTKTHAGRWPWSSTGADRQPGTGQRLAGPAEAARRAARAPLWSWPATDHPGLLARR
jgi:transposase